MYLENLMERARVARGEGSSAWYREHCLGQLRQSVQVVRAVADTSDAAECRRVWYALRNLLCQARVARRDAGLRRNGRLLTVGGASVFEVIKAS